MATFLLKLFRGSLLLCENEGGSVPHSVPCETLGEKTPTPLPPPSSTPFPSSLPAERRNELPASSRLPLCCLFCLPLPSSLLSPLLSPAPSLRQATAFAGSLLRHLRRGAGRKET